MRSEFYINLTKGCVAIDKSVGWYLNSFNFGKRSLERQICELKRQLYMRDAKKYIRKAEKCLN